MIPENRTLTNPFLSHKETNEVLVALRGLTNSPAINSNKYGQSLVDSREEDLPITLQIEDSNDIPPFSILLVNNIGTASRIYRPGKAEASGRVHGTLKAPLVTPVTERDHLRHVYATNGGHAIKAAGGILDCWILGTHRPHPIRYVNRQGLAGQVTIGDRLGFTAGTVLIPDSMGPFVAVSNGTVINQDNPIGIVWVIVHHHQLSYIPWVQTCVASPGDEIYNSDTAVYPPDGSNTFVVRRGEYRFTETPGFQNLTFVPYSPNEYYIAIHPCGYLPQGTVRRMTIDHGLAYLIYDCTPQHSSISSSSISSSSDSSSSDSSSDSPSSSDSSSDSSSSDSSSVSPSSSDSSSDSSSVSPSSSSQASPPSQSSSSSPFDEQCGAGDCVWECASNLGCPDDPDPDFDNICWIVVDYNCPLSSQICECIPPVEICSIAVINEFVVTGCRTKA